MKNKFFLPSKTVTECHTKETLLSRSGMKLLTAKPNHIWIHEIANSQLKEILLPWRTVPHPAHWYRGATSWRIPRQPGHLTNRTLEVNSPAMVLQLSGCNQTMMSSNQQYTICDMNRTPMLNIKGSFYLQSLRKTIIPVINIVTRTRI